MMKIKILLLALTIIIIIIIWETILITHDESSERDLYFYSFIA